MRGGHWGRGALPAAVLAALVPHAAGAAPTPSGRTSVVVLPPAVDGELPDVRRDELVQALRDGLARGEFEVLDADAGLKPCKTPTCVTQVATGAGADYAVTMTVAVERRDYTITLDLVEAATGRNTAHSEERCEVCGIAEARDVVDSQAAALRNRLEALALEAPLLSFESTPGGAIVRLDGTVVGETPLERAVEPGPHRVDARKPGYVPEARSFEAVAGVSSTIAFELAPVPRSVRYRKLRTFGWVALGVGAASIVAGATLLVLDGKPNTVSCSGENIDPLGNCKFLYSTLEAGIAVTAIGVALLAAGVGIAIATRDRRRASKVSLGPRGLTWSRAF